MLKNCFNEMSYPNVRNNPCTLWLKSCSWPLQLSGWKKKIPLTYLAPNNAQNYMLIYGYVTFYAGNTCVCVCKGTLPFPQSCKQIISSFLLEWMAKILSSYELRAAFQPLQIFKFLQGAFILVPQSLSCNHNTTQGLCSPSRVVCKRFCKATCAILQP